MLTRRNYYFCLTQDELGQNGLNYEIEDKLEVCNQSSQIYFKCTNFREQKLRDFREFWPFSRKFMLLKILNRPIRESLCSRKKVISKIR